MKRMEQSDSGIFKNLSIGGAPWFVGWIYTKQGESNIYTQPGCPSVRLPKPLEVIGSLSIGMFNPSI